MLKVAIDASTEPEVVRNTHLSEEAPVAPTDDNKDNNNIAGDVLLGLS